MNELLLYAAAVAELILFGYVLATASRERRGLARFVQTAREPEKLKDTAKTLPAIYRASAIQFAGDLNRKSPLDEALIASMTKAANTSFGLGAFGRVGFAVGVTAVLLAPLATALAQAALSVAHVRDHTERLSGARLFLRASGAIEPSFTALEHAFTGSALLLAGLMLTGALHWWLNRAEVREARLVKSFLEAAIIARPSAGAPVAGRLSALLAPERGLGRPLASWLFFFVAAGLGWSVLYATAGVREANRDAQYHVMGLNSRAFTQQSGLLLPTMSGGGRDLAAPNALTLHVGPMTAGTSDGLEIAPIDDKGELPPGWGEAKVPKLTEKLREFTRNSKVEVMMPVHRNLPIKTPLSILRYLKSDVDRVFLIFERGVERRAESGAGHPAAGSLRAELPVLLKDEGTAPLLTLDLDTQTVVVDADRGADAAHIRTDRSDWRRQLMRAVRQRTFAMNDALPAYRVELRFKSREMTYEKVMDVLTTADNSCPPDQGTDCGIPGIGLEMTIKDL